MSQIVLSFTCSMDTATLLMVAYDCFTDQMDKKGFEFVTLENINWFLDELASILPEIHDQKLQFDGDGKGLSHAAGALLEYELARRERFKQQYRDESLDKNGKLV